MPEPSKPDPNPAEQAVRDLFNTVALKKRQIAPQLPPEGVDDKDLPWWIK